MIVLLTKLVLFIRKKNFKISIYFFLLEVFSKFTKYQRGENRIKINCVCKRYLVVKRMNNIWQKKFWGGGGVREGRRIAKNRMVTSPI